jgi:hypothetical protein
MNIYYYTRQYICRRKCYAALSIPTVSAPDTYVKGVALVGSSQDSAGAELQAQVSETTALDVI